MIVLAALLGRSLRRIAALFTSLIALLLTFQIALVAVARSFEGREDFSGLMAVMPDFVRNVFGSALASFSGMAVIGYFDPLPVMVVVQFAIYLATEPAGDVEAGLVDLILARPVARHRPITRSLVLMVLCASVLILTMGTGTWIALHTIAPEGADWPRTDIVLTLMAHLWSVGLCAGGFGLAAGAIAQRRGAAFAPIAIAAVALYLLDGLGESWDAIEPLARLSPFHYYHGAEILAGTANTRLDLTVLLTSAVIATAVAYWRFSARDV